MDEKRSVELGRGEYRPVFTGPLGKYLGWSTAGAVVLTAIAAVGSLFVDAWWAFLMPIPPAILIGVCWAGFTPAYWFRDPPNT
jgi:hypothetical protein